MPIATEHYLLEAFLDGDSYSSIIDKRRFTTIDNQLYRVAELIGDGCITGWDIVTSTFPNVIISQGSGLIDGYYVDTFNDQTFELTANGTFYFYAQRRIGIIGTVGPKGNMVSIAYTDLFPPANPTNLVLQDPVQSGPYTYSVSMQWVGVGDADLSHYEIQRQTDGGGFQAIGTNTTVFYADTIDEDATYDYRIYAVDYSGNYSAGFANGSVTVALTDTAPPNPYNVRMPYSKYAINLLWDRPPSIDFANIDHWLITYVKLDTNDNELADTFESFIVNKSLYHTRIEDLSLGQKYKVSLYTVDVDNRASTGVSQHITPQPSPAPRDPQGIGYSFDPGEYKVRIYLSWTSGDTPYDTILTYRYKVYVTVEGETESLPFDVNPPGATEEQISIYTHDLVNYNYIPENTLVTIRITALDVNGFESFGNYVKFVTPTFSLPKRLANLQAEFDSDTNQIIATWENQSDTYYVRIQILDNDIEVLNTNIDKAEEYRYTAALGHKYTISVTPYNEDGVAGPTSTAIEYSTSSTNMSFPLAPGSIETKANDRQISLTWTKSESLFANGYVIYKKQGSVTLSFDEWTLLDTIDSVEITNFTDYGLTNGQLYSYYIISTDIYGRETPHLSTQRVNLNFVSATPKEEGTVTEPTNITATLVGSSVILTWDSLLEEFDSFTIYRSVNNLHEWEELATVDKDVFTYTDNNIELINGQTYYYLIDKSVNDSDIVVQTSKVSPENSIYLGSIVLTSDSFNSPDLNGKRNILDMEDPIEEWTSQYLLTHKHRDIEALDPERIDLSPALEVVDWSTIDGRIWTTSVDISGGTSYVLRVNNRFPQVFYTINESIGSITFSEAIDENSELFLKVLGIEEVTGVLESFRFDNIHAKQIQFGALNQEQLPDINHEGRIRERMFPQRFLLERYNNHSFIVSQESSDSTETFGDGTTFFSVIASDGNIEEVIDFDQYENGAEIGFHHPLFSPTTSTNLMSDVNVAEVVSEGFQSEKSYYFEFDFIDNNPIRWVRLSTEDSPVSPNPVVDLKKRIRFRILLQSGSIYLALGIREIYATNLSVGSNGGTAGPIEWVGVSEIITDNEESAPKGILISASDQWQEVDIDLTNTNIVSFENGNGSLGEGLGVLEHLAITINPDNVPSGSYKIYIDKIEQVSDVLVSGTSQGILLSSDFGITWNLSRYTDTPVHKFYQARNNAFLWAITADEVLLSVDPAFWFVVEGTTGVQYIKDIAEDSEGNMYISTDKGVYFLEVALIYNFTSFKQTQPVTAFSSECYGLYHNALSTGQDEIWVSTEIGIYKTTNYGESWQDTGMSTQGLVAYEFLNISNDSKIPNIFAITRKHVLRKYGNQSNFVIVANFEEQHGVFDIWTMQYFAEHLYIATGNGVYSHDIANLSIPGNLEIDFERIFPDLIINDQINVAFCLDVVATDTGNQMFIGQENRLMVSNETNRLTLKTEYPNKELPGFYIDDEEINIGYVYSAFNKVLSFREPLLATNIVSASNLPRRVFIAQNEGWAQTNADAEIFIYQNGIPTWLYFQLSESEVVAEAQLIEGRLSNLPQLTTFNSLYPQSQTYFDATVNSIQTIKTGGDNDTPLVNAATVSDFISNYSRFLSLITDELKENASLSEPEILSSGISRSSRESGTRAATLEDMEEFESKNCVGINVDTYTGEVDFRTAYANATTAAARADLSFDKNDQLEITIFHSNVFNAGEYTHTELENQLEMYNTGMSSYLGSAVYGNLIQLGIFLESQNHYLFDRYNASNIQSKFYAAYTNTWYDIVNSTIDYKLLLKIENYPEPRFANVTYLSTDNPYFGDVFWIGTDSDILQYTLTSEGELILENIIRPGNGSEALYISDIYEFDNNIYIVAINKTTNVSKIYQTDDFGTTWTELETINLPNLIYKFTIINGNKVAGTEEGLFYCDNDFGTWYPCDLATPITSTDTARETAFRQRILRMNNTTFVVAESDRYLYTSGSGIEFFAVGRATGNDMTVINTLIRAKNLTWIGTDKGLYNDGNSILSDSVQLGFETGLETSSLGSVVEVNDIAVGSQAIYACGSNGKVYRYYDENVNNDTGNEWKRYLVPSFGTIHKMLLYETGFRDYLIITSYNKIRAIEVTPGSGVFD